MRYDDTREMVWNHRVIIHVEKDGPKWVGIHECFYNKGDTIPHSWTEDPIKVAADTKDDLVELLERFKKATSQPFLKEDGDKVIEV